jgi:hypothetical protein
MRNESVRTVRTEQFAGDHLLRIDTTPGILNLNPDDDRRQFMFIVVLFEMIGGECMFLPFFFAPCNGLQSKASVCVNLRNHQARGDSDSASLRSTFKRQLKPCSEAITVAYLLREFTSITENNQIELLDDH